MIADFAIHDTGRGNPHAHILLTVRGIDEKSEWMQKQRTVFANSRDARGRPIYDPNLPAYDAKNKEATSKYRIPALDKNGKQKVRVRKGKGTEYLWEKITIPINDWNEHSKAEIWRASWAEECNKYLAKDKHIDHRSYERQGVDMEPMIHEGIIARQMEKDGQIADRCEINREVRERNRLRESIRKLAKEITEIIVEKARDLIDRIRGFTGSFKYHRKPGRASQYIGGTGKGDSFTSSRQGATSRRAGRAGEYQQFIDAANQKLSDTDREIAATDKRIDELKSLIKEKEAERNERIRKIMERRRASGYVGTAGESNRGIQKSNAELSGYALKHELTTKDYSEFVDILKYKDRNPNKADRDRFTKEEINKIWTMCEDKYYQIILMLIYNGVRISELLDLKKENIHLEEQYFDVIDSKTENGIRKVPIADKVLEFYKGWFYDGITSEYLLHTDDGKHFLYRNYYDSYFKPLMKNLNIERTPHCCRHTCISMLADAHVDQTTIKKIVGHAGAMTLTEKVYTHMDIGELIKAINLI